MRLRHRGLRRLRTAVQEPRPEVAPAEGQEERQALLGAPSEPYPYPYPLPLPLALALALALPLPLPLPLPLTRRSVRGCGRAS